MSKLKSLIIPCEQAQFALSEHKEWPVHCYNLMKYDMPGHGYLNDYQITVLSDYLGRSKRTVWRYIDYLLEIGWIEKWGKIYTIKSWERVFDLMGWRHAWGVEEFPENIEDPQAFFAGVVIGRLANYQKFKRSRDNKDGAIIPSCACPSIGSSTHFPVADRALSKILSITISKANKLKKIASKHGYIDLRPNYYKYSDNGHLVKVTLKNTELFRRVYDESHNVLLRVGPEGQTTIQGADIVKPNMIYKKSSNYH